MAERRLADMDNRTYYLKKKGYINKMFRSNIGVGQPDPNMCFGTAYV